MVFVSRLVLFLLCAVLLHHSVVNSLVNTGSAQSIDFRDLYGSEDFQFNFGNSAMAEVPRVTVTAVLAPSRENSDTVWLVLDVRVPADWHLYSLTQKPGGTIPATIQLDNTVLQQGILPPSQFFVDRPPHLNHVEYFSVPLEEHDQQVVWFGKMTVVKDPTTAKITGVVSGQICQAGEGGSCIQVDVPFTAKWEPEFDVAPLITAAKTVSRTFGGLLEDENSSGVSSDISTESDSRGGQSDSATGSAGFLDWDTFQTDDLVTVSHLGVALLCAFFGGMILNIMPCVLPIIGLKILSFFEQAGKSRSRAFQLNVVYSCGILSVFLVLATMSVGLSQMFAYHLFNIVMVVVVFTLSLSMMDVWEIRLPSFIGGQKSVELMQREGLTGAFFKGVITTLLAIPCSAPFLGPALAWSDAQIRSGAQFNVFMVYGMIGIGMSSPYLLIGAFPEMLRFLPKPGDWMDTFKHIMGYGLLLAVVWLLYFMPFPLVVPVVALLFGCWFACWFIGSIPYGTASIIRLSRWSIAAAVLVFVILFSFDLSETPLVGSSYNLQTAMQRRLDRMVETAVSRTIMEYGGSHFVTEEKVITVIMEDGEVAEKIVSLRSPITDGTHWQPFTEEKWRESLLAGKKVVIDFTADWCLTCKVFEATVLESQSVLAALDSGNIVSLQGDITHRDSPAAVLLKKLGGGTAIPIVAIFDPKSPNTPKMIHGGCSQKTLIAALEN